jgi:hypothetical protein
MDMPNLIDRINNQQLQVIFIYKKTQCCYTSILGMFKTESSRLHLATFIFEFKLIYIYSVLNTLWDSSLKSQEICLYGILFYPF